jgi:hypothetical protein
MPINAVNCGFCRVAIYGDLAYKLFTAAGFGGEFIRGGEAA